MKRVLLENGKCVGLTLIVLESSRCFTEVILVKCADINNLRVKTSSHQDFDLQNHAVCSVCFFAVQNAAYITISRGQ